MSARPRIVRVGALVSTAEVAATAVSRETPGLSLADWIGIDIFVV
jgi:hypothetical protein